jgi:hypothetical protein
MPDFIDFTFDDGTCLALQVFDLPPRSQENEGKGDAVPGFGGSRPVARGSRVVAATEGALTSLLAPLGPLLQSVHGTVMAVPNTPRELSVTFGLRVSHDLKLGIVGAGGEATMTVVATWNLPGVLPPPSSDSETSASHAQ